MSSYVPAALHINFSTKFEIILYMISRLLSRCRIKWEVVAFSECPPPPLIVDRSVNPISTRGADYAHHSNTSPPGFSDLATGLQI